MTENSHEACRPKENTGASSVWIQEAGCIKTVLITGNLITGNVDPCGTTVRYSWFVQEPVCTSRKDASKLQRLYRSHSNYRTALIIELP